MPIFATLALNYSFSCMISCMVVDDEPWALALMADYIGKMPFLELTFSTGNVVEALQKIQEQHIDLVFLDIQMPEITGLQFMKIVSGKCRFILTTAYSEFALDGYEYNVIDYLLKPISFDRFYTAALKAQEVLKTTQSQPQNTLIPAPSNDTTSEYIFVKTDGKMVKILLTEILFIEGLKDYIAINTDKEKIIVLENLKTLQEGLSADKFIRIHKSYIVSIDKIDTIERNRVFIGKDIVLPIGDTYKEQFFAAIKGKNFG